MKAPADEPKDTYKRFAISSRFAGKAGNL